MTNICVGTEELIGSYVQRCLEPYDVEYEYGCYDDDEEQQKEKLNLRDFISNVLDYKMRLYFWDVCEHGKTFSSEELDEWASRSPVLPVYPILDVVSAETETRYLPEETVLMGVRSMLALLDPNNYPCRHSASFFVDVPGIMEVTVSIPNVSGCYGCLDKDLSVPDENGSCPDVRTFYNTYSNQMESLDATAQQKMCMEAAMGMDEHDEENPSNGDGVEESVNDVFTKRVMTAAVFASFSLLLLAFVL